MSGMYPNNQVIEIFGEQVSWPGVDGDGKFTNGSFTDPMVKPSFIPAETINLILDNLTELIKKCGGAPDSVTVSQLAALLATAASPKSIMMRDAAGRAKAAKPVEDDDIARKIDIQQAVGERGSQAQVELSKMTYIADNPAAASTANVNIQTGGLLVIDGVQTAAGDLIFLKDQVEKNENGFWKVQTGAWNRYPGYTEGECFTDKLITVPAGAANAGKIFFLDGALLTIGTDSLVFIESPFASEAKPGKIAIRDREGKIKDLHGVNVIIHAASVEGWGRDLFDVMGVNRYNRNAPTVAEKQALGLALKQAGNNTATAAAGTPYYSGLMIGDYIDGLDLSVIPAENGGTAGQAWNDTYKNNRIVLSAFNPYIGAGDTENQKNHLLFTFRNCPITKRMRSDNTNDGGYINSTKSELRAFLEGTSGDGTGDISGVTTAAFLNAMKAQMGDIFYKIRKLHSVKSGNSWASYIMFLLSEIEVFGVPVWGDEGVYLASDTATSSAARAGSITPLQLPIFRDSYLHRIKRYNGNRQWHWLSTPYSAGSSSFCAVSNSGHTANYSAGSAGGVAPAFCVA